jgi:hypothetical protein
VGVPRALGCLGNTESRIDTTGGSGYINSCTYVNHGTAIKCVESGCEVGAGYPTSDPDPDVEDQD